MVELIKQQVHFLKLVVQTSPTQRTALLRTITRPQVKAVSQIAYNILRFTIKLTLSEKARLKRYKRLVHLLGNRKVGFYQKKEAIGQNSRTVYTLIKIALEYLKPVLP